MDYYEGELIVAQEDDPNPHFEFHYTDEEGDPCLRTLNAGRSLEVAMQGYWIQGSVELGYYEPIGGKGLWFLSTGDGDIILYTGMKARMKR